jgi:ATP-dependent 26S proteasome regulatory subunit
VTPLVLLPLCPVVAPPLPIHHRQNIPFAPDVQLHTIARGTPGFSGADLANLVNVAALHAAKSGQQAVTMASLEYARDRCVLRHWFSKQTFAPRAAGLCCAKTA